MGPMGPALLKVASPKRMARSTTSGAADFLPLRYSMR
jgi:hypothetical protein